MPPLGRTPRRSLPNDVILVTLALTSHCVVEVNHQSRWIFNEPTVSGILSKTKTTLA